MRGGFRRVLWSSVGTIGLVACSGDSGSSSDETLVGASEGDTRSWSILDLDCRVEVPTTGRPEGLLALQLDDDLADELVVVNRRPGSEAGVLEVFDDVLSPTRTVELPGYPIGPVAFDDDGPRVAIASRSTNEVVVYDPRDLREVRRVTLPARPRAIGVGALRGVGTSTIVVATNAGTLVTVDGEVVVSHPATDGLPTFVKVEPSLVVVGSQEAFGVRRFFLDGEALVPQELEATGGIPRSWLSTPTGEFVTSGDDALMTRVVTDSGTSWQRVDRAGSIPLDVQELGAGQLVSLSFVDLALRVWRDGEVHQRIEAGQDPWAFDVADVDGDGMRDLVVANRALQRVSVILGGQGGSFRPAATVSTGEGPKHLAAGDVDGDGHLDVASVNVLDGTVGLHLGSQGGLRTPHVLAPSGSGVLGIVMVRDEAEAGSGARVHWYPDGDESLQLHEGRWNEGTFTVGLADTHITEVVGVSAVSPGTTYLIATPEAVIETRGDLSVGFRGVHLASHGHPLVQALGRRPQRDALAVGSEDETGPEIRVAEFEGDALRLTGGWGTRLPGTPVSIAWAELDGDRDLELIVLTRGVTDNSPGHVLVYDRADGSYAERERHSTGLRPFAIAAGDVDGDGLDDVVVSAQNSHHLNFWRGRDGGLTAMPDLGCGRGPLGVLMVDLDGDGRDEIVCANNFSNDLTVIRTR